MDNLAQRHIKQIDSILADLGKISLPISGDLLADFNFTDNVFKIDDSETPQVHQFYGDTLNILSNLFGPKSPQVKSLTDERKMIESKRYSTDSTNHKLREICCLISGVLTSTKNNIEAGLITNILIQASGAVIGDFLSIAKKALRDGNKDVAAILASAALEDALKRKAAELGLKVENRKLSNVVNDLNSKGFFSSTEFSIVSSYVKLRNDAMHTDQAKIQEADVSGLIRFLEPFLIKNFS